MSGERVLVLGTRNAKKKRELVLLLNGTGIRPATLDEFSGSVEVDETGSTFAENARLKASLQARAIGQWVLGEDSGLCVDALDGAPGVYSARFSGTGATDATNNAKLQESLRGIPLDRRTAHYVCHASLSDPSGEIVIDCEGTCRGRIVDRASGAGGFGYDPYFEIPEYHATFAQLGDSVKSLLSHRARAMRQFLTELERLIGRGGWPIV